MNAIEKMGCVRHSALARPFKCDDCMLIRSAATEARLRAEQVALAPIPIRLALDLQGAVKRSQIAVRRNAVCYEAAPVPMVLTCPSCCARHIDEGEFATRSHHTHACQHCGMVWRPAIVPTVGVRFLPGFKNEDAIAAEQAKGGGG